MRSESGVGDQATVFRNARVHTMDAGRPRAESLAAESLAVGGGRLADFTVLECDPLAVPPQEIRDIAAAQISSAARSSIRRDV